MQNDFAVQTLPKAVAVELIEQYRQRGAKIDVQYGVDGYTTILINQRNIPRRRSEKSLSSSAFRLHDRKPFNAK